MFNVKETQDAECFARAQSRGQRTFTLVEQDASAVKTIAEWIKLNIETAPPDKLRAALEDCIKWREFPKRKNAD